MIRITQMKLPITHTEEQLQKKITKTLRLGNTPFTYKIHKQSLDARHKDDKKFVYTIDVKTDNESRVLKKIRDKNVMLTKETCYHFPEPGSEKLLHPPVVTEAVLLVCSVHGILQRPVTVRLYWNVVRKLTNASKQ